MKFVKKGVIMIDNPEDLKEKALANKPGLRKQYVNIPVGDEEYGFRISGIGAKAIKLENMSNMMKYLKHLKLEMKTVWKQWLNKSLKIMKKKTKKKQNNHLWLRQC